jgi:signal transduction histidine kinase
MPVGVDDPRVRVTGFRGLKGLVRTVAFCLIAVTIAFGASQAAAVDLPRSILVLEQSDVRGPFYALIFDALRTEVNAAAKPVSLYVENLDLSRFQGEEYEQAVDAFLNLKYRDKPISLILTVGDKALEFALRWRTKSWPDTPVVFAFVDESTAAALSLPHDVTGKTTRLRLEDMVSAARAIVPGLQQVALVGDRLETQVAFAQFKDQLPAVQAEIEVLDLTGLPMAELRKRVAALPERSAVLYTAVYSDGAGTYFPPATAVQMIAEVANRPIIAPIETYIGKGAIGGYVAVPSVIGNEAAQLALRILDGEQPSAIPITGGASLRPVFDWPTMQRWGVDQSDLPAGSEIRNRTLPIWKQYPRQTAAVGVVVALQSGLIMALLYEHRRRRKAEITARARLNELAHLNRQATAGELSAVIAHEVNQPLGAILSNTEAAELLLSAPTPDIGEVKDILADIKRDNQRASDVVVRSRRLLKKAPVISEDVDVNAIVREAFAFAAAQASASKIHLETQLKPLPLYTRGDPVQLQQVVLILVLNSIDALHEATGTRRLIIGSTSRAGTKHCEVRIADTGPGIVVNDLDHVFDPFFSTKKQGMGMGLPIARSIVEMHGGTISAANSRQGGAEFTVRLPLARTVESEIDERAGAHS